MDRKLERTVSKLVDRFVGIVHAEHDSWSFKFVDFHDCRLAAILGSEGHCECSCFLGDKVGGTVLITKSVSSNNDWLSPTRNTSWDVFDNDWLAEDDTTNNVANSAVRGLPHLLEVKLLNSSFVGGNRCTLNADLASFDGFCGVNGNLVICGITVFDTKIVVLDVEIKVGEDELDMKLGDRLRYLPYL